MSTKKKEKVLSKDTVLGIKLSKPHPHNKMFLNGVLISGYVHKNYILPAGTNLDAVEVKTWFEIEKPVKGKDDKISPPVNAPVEENEEDDKSSADQNPPAE